MAVTTSITADTPEQMKAAIVAFLTFRATQERCKRWTTPSMREKEAYENKAAFLEGLIAEIQAAETRSADA